MKITLAKQAGFCFGVKRAVDLAENAPPRGGDVYTLGPLIHNSQVTNRLARQGVRNIDHLAQVTEGTVIFRSHGVSPQTLEEAQRLQLNIVDATCPFVKNAQAEAKKLAENGYTVVVVGEREHPEVQAVAAWAKGCALIVGNTAEAEQLPPLAKAGIVAQTTLSPREFHEITEIIRGKAEHIEVCPTICNATLERQAAAEELAKKADLMIVIGGKHSANTSRLAEICAKTGTPTYHIETAQELKREWFTGVKQAGITAGASTPDWIIEEVYHTMQDLDFSKAFEESIKEIDRGGIVTGTVIQVGRDEVFVDIGYKSEGIIPRNELTVKSDVQPADIVSVGDVIEVFVLKQEGKDGYPILSKKRADARKGWVKIEETYKAGTVQTVPVLEAVKGGLVVSINDLRGFVPASQVERRFVADLSGYVGKELRVKILEIDRGKNKVVLSQKVVLEEEAAKSKEETMAVIEEGQIREGIVRRLTDYGAFVDIGGIEGLLHVSEMSWQRVKDPASIVKAGEQIPVKILKIDRENYKISLGLKQTQADPWSLVAEKYQVGELHKGTVVRLTKFGAFVALEPGIDGLVHISQLAETRVNKPDDVVTVGEEVTVKIVDVNPQERRIGLSMREVQQEREAQAEAAVDSDAADGPQAEQD
ncbi:MAG TPA: bifunctional 4-hydroxy-3-methylbut-2-enyl diphosphate reductase/30S ribosomal protein S1 [Negativicutes bacterium]|nr:bifunctional 4-hydroxy-3-methylbut-2-enyl diphosphate reductase/30S ribosomal protein S1 [Negativicutes bacterium]